MTPPTQTALPDRLGPYVVGSVIGVGAAAIVVAARDDRLDADVAIKLLRSADPEVRERFLREARLLRRVSHPAVVTVHDVGETPDGRPFLVMDLAQCSLTDRLRTATPPADAATLRAVARALTDGLGALHRAGIVHRDVKPANLLLMTDVASGTELANGAVVGPDERVVIGDLGFAKDQRLLNPGTTLLGGTPGFRSPEQLEYGQRVDARADVYAATAVLWTLVTGRPPPSVDTLALDVQSAPPAWRDVVRTGMSADAASRFPDMARWALAVEAAIGEVDAPAPKPAPVAASTLPYKGLAAFQPEDAALFFGRAELVDQLLTRLAHRHVLVVGGASGSGKSSVVRAGLIPRLEAGALAGSADRRTRLLTPGANPMRALGDPPTDPVLLVVDQFEELFTLCRDPEEQNAFLGVLADASAGARPLAHVVLVVRADFYAACATRPWLAEAINANQVLVPPMSREDLRQVIEGPARRVGLHLQDQLTDRILADAGEDPGGLPLLAHALAQTWLRREGDVLTLAGYLATGGVDGALQRSADEVWLHLDADDRPVARRLLLRLVQAGDGTPDTRRLLRREDLDDRHHALITRFAEARLLTVDGDGVRLAHEAVLRSWPAMAAWISEERDDLRTARRLDEAAADWQRGGEHSDLLLRGTPLDAAGEWRERQQGDVPLAVALFLAESRAEQALGMDAERTRAHRAARARRRVLTALTTLTAFAVLASIVAAVGLARSRHDAQVARSANAEAATALSQSLGASAQSLAESRPHLAASLAVRAMSDGRPTVAARDALVRARLAMAGTRLVPVGDPLRAPAGLAVAIAPSGNSAAVGRRDGSVWVWNLTDASPSVHLRGPTGGVQSVAYTADGSTVVAGSADGTVWAWDVSSGVGRKLAEPGSVVWTVATAPSGTTVAAGTASGQAWLLDGRSGATLGDPLVPPNGDVMTLAFAENGATLLGGSGSGQVTAWSVADRSARWSIDAARSRILDLTVCQSCVVPAFATVSSSGIAQVWDVATGAERPRPSALPGGIRGASFSAGGTGLTLGAADGALHSWPLAGGDVDRMEGHRNRITGLATSNDGRTVVSLSDDQTVQVWTRAPRPSPIVRIAEAGPANALAIGPDAAVLAVGRADGAVVLLDSVTGAERSVLKETSNAISSLTFLDAARLVTGDDSGTLRIWDVAARRLLATRSAAHDGPIAGVHALGDGRLVSVGNDRFAREWPANLREPTAQAEFTAALTDVAVDEQAHTVVATGRTGEVDRWDLRDGSIARIAALGDTAWTVALAGGLVVTGAADELVSAWDTELGASVERWQQAANIGGALALTVVNGTTVAIGAGDGRIRFVDLVTGDPIGSPLALATAPVRQIAAHGALVWTIDGDGGVYRTDALDPSTACAAVGTPFGGRPVSGELGCDTTPAAAR